MNAVEHRWSHTEELMVALCQLVDNLCRITASAHGGQRAVRSLGKPFRYPRPGEKPAGPVVLAPRELAGRMLRGG